MEPLTLIKLDELELLKRIDLNTTDQCRYWQTYTPKENYNFSETNRLIKNFKISPQEKHRLTHKKAAIEQIADEFMQIIPDRVYENFIFVPVPPSKPSNHPEYDDVLTKGTHFKVMQKILNQHYPQAPTIGLFIALSIYAN